MHCLFESVTQYFTWGLDKDLFYSATITVQNMHFLSRKSFLILEFLIFWMETRQKNLSKKSMFCSADPILERSLFTASSRPAAVLRSTAPAAVPVDLHPSGAAAVQPGLDRLAAAAPERSDETRGSADPGTEEEAQRENHTTGPSRRITVLLV